MIFPRSTTMMSVRSDRDSRRIESRDRTKYCLNRLCGLILWFEGTDAFMCVWSSGTEQINVERQECEDKKRSEEGNALIIKL
jgi:hypothetical protein